MFFCCVETFCVFHGFIILKIFILCRYFLCIVALHAHAGGKTYTVAACATEKIIVRASNPGQFDQDDIQWQRGQVSDAIYHNVSYVYLFIRQTAFRAEHFFNFFTSLIDNSDFF